MSVTGIISSGDTVTGTLGASGVQVISMRGRPLPANCSLVSADAGAKIEIQNGPTSPYFEPTYDRDAGGELAVSITVGVYSVKFTGAENDAWSLT